RPDLGSLLVIPGAAFGDIALVPAPFLKAPKGIRDVSEWYISTLTRRDYVRAVFERQCAIALGNIDVLIHMFGDLVQVAYITGTDFGTQRGPFISRAAYRELYQPFHRVINDHIHRHTRWKTFMHSCGSVYQLIPDFIEAGFDILNPVQCSAADMDAARLKREFGKDIVFWGGGVDTQRTLAFGTPAQVYDALPMVKKLGFGWVTLDDGWQTAEGDWFLHPEKFPGGDRDMRAMVDKFHAQGFRAQLWWAPLAADPGTELLEKHREMLLLNADGSPRHITWWNSWYLCPADPAVIEYHRKLVVKFLRDWDYDGLKLDGQHLNGVPPCYNPAHKHAHPEESVEALPQLFKAIYETALSIKPHALVELCPCGTAHAFHNLPYMNMSVASDPRGSWQIRLKGKTLKALHGDAVAYFGDHVELSDEGLDFASTVGIGGIVGTNFRWPPGSGGQRKGRGDLTPDRETQFRKWLAIYREKMLSRGEYLGELYDIGFDRPEAHAIRKQDTIYYAFFAPAYKGRIELRGLVARTYRVTEYVDGRDLGRVRGPLATLDVEFQRHLLVEARPE
ncbi:MAG: alpha-galactosidase, partial [Bryobacteraceae bacterium]